MAKRILFIGLVILGITFGLFFLGNSGAAATGEYGQSRVQDSRPSRNAAATGEYGQSRVQDSRPSRNIQIQALEVTQGVRGEIPSRMAPEGGLVLSPGGAVHIANRRTIVRAYPWVVGGPEAAVPPVTARLWVYRDGVLLPGSPITPDNYNLENISPDWDLGEMRSDSEKSWNFLLPPAWTASDSQLNPFTLRFVVEVNPSGPDHQPECRGCSSDNQVSLAGQEFVTVPALVIQPYFVGHTVMEPISSDTP